MQQISAAFKYCVLHPQVVVVMMLTIPSCMYVDTQEFYEANKDKPLVLLKWLSVQAGSSLPGNLKNVKALMDHPSFTITTPNCCYSLFLGFARSVNFHAADGSGYEFMGDAVVKVGPATEHNRW